MKLLRILSNKFLVTTAIFVVWMMFFDQNDFFSQKERMEELQDTKDNIGYLNAEIAGMEKDYNALISDPKRLEKYAREHYRMKRDNEDLYVIEKK
ncbi:FtsB family cell division protein [Taibaiella soli]|uniref:Septum formation initiator family protein n=1 Tax=Taibaiella soli TaxID=1649169 RepID=A0A2W2AXK4_9BACT|nr:septum formation initiator family protein [Taibaiella soli]PZF72398.1 septum formation initiator family protein [Taibaiella soli]